LQKKVKPTETTLVIKAETSNHLRCCFYNSCLPDMIFNILLSVTDSVGTLKDGIYELVFHV